MKILSRGGSAKFRQETGRLAEKKRKSESSQGRKRHLSSTPVDISSFVPLVFAAEDEPPASEVDCAVEIRFPGAAVLIIHAGSDATAIRSVIQAIGPYWFSTHVPEDEANLAWNELYAQVLDFVGYANPANHYGFTTPDQFMKNGYFSCAQYWADTVRTTGAAPGSYSTCDVDHRPIWYGDIN